MPVVGKFPFLNRALNRDSNFDLSKSEDNLEVDRLLTDPINTKQQSSRNHFKFSYVNSRFGPEEPFVRVPSSTTDQSFQKSYKFLTEVIEKK